MAYDKNIPDVLQLLRLDLGNVDYTVPMDTTIARYAIVGDYFPRYCISRKGNRVLSYIDFLAQEQVCPIDRIGETHLYGFDATEPGSFDEVIECHQLLDIREMLGNDHITLGGEAQAMKAASAEMAESMEKHDIVLDAR